VLILPTKGRPDNLRRFIKAYNDTKGSLPISVIFDANDGHLYNAVETPSHWRRVSAPAGTPLGGIFDLVFKKYPSEAFYGMVADDVVPETEGWDILLSEACQPDKIAWGLDELQNDFLPVHPFIGGDLVRKLGFWAAPKLKHWYVDNVWKEIAIALDCAVYRPDIRMIHRHFSNGRAQMDRTYRQQPDHETDRFAYERFMQEHFPPLIERLKPVVVA
jgi:hypothetical protein